MNALTLYNVNQELEALLNQVDEETGEIPESLMEQINALSLKREDLIHTAGIIHLMSKADSETVDSEIKRLQAIKKSYARRAEATERLLNKYVRLGEEFKFNNMVIKWKKNPPKVEADLIDLNELQAEHPELVRIEYALDKNKIKELAKDGKPLPEGIRVVQESTLQIK